jgi:chlorophyllide a reductase subunit Y
MPSVALIGELFPVDPVGVSAMLKPMGLSVAPQVPSREWRDLYAALDSVVAAAVHPFYTSSVREFQRAGRPIVGSGPVGVEGTADWLDAVGISANVPTKQIDAAKAAATGAIMGALAENMIDATVTVSGYEGSELLVARLLVEAGARVPYVGTACPKTEWSQQDVEWLESHGVHVQYRASLEDDLYAMKDAKPDLALGTTPLVQAAKEMGIPSIYFTNMVSARPLFGPAGAGSLAGIVAAQTKGKERFTKMLDFFGEIGTGDMAGYGWTESRVEAAKKAAAEKPAVVAVTDDKSDKKASITDAKAGKEDTLEMAIGN